MSHFTLKMAVSSVAVGVVMATSGIATAAGLPVSVNGATCGTYTDATFNSQGHLLLKGNFTCGSTAPVDPVDPDPVDPDPVDPDPVDPVDPAPIACGTPPESGWGTIDHVWTQNIAANARMPISLKGLQVYSLKLVDEKDAQGNIIPKGKGGYGTVKTYDLPGNIGTRTLVISECPNSMVPAAPDTIPGLNPCISVNSATTTVAWSHKENNPSITQCKLDPAKQYYVNVQHVAAPNTDLTCKAGSCVFIMDYGFGKKL